MRRGGPLKRRTSLARGTSRLERRTRLRAVGSKRQRETPEYRAAVAAHLAEYPNCQIGPVVRAAGFAIRCLVTATHVHHTRGRGRYLCDRSTFRSSCSGECHPRWIHQTNVKEARELGLLLF